MIGVFVNTGTSGGVEKKERSGEWDKAEYYGNGKYLLYSSMPGCLNLHCSVVAKRHEDYDGKTFLNSFDLLRYHNPDLEMEINGQRVFDGVKNNVTGLQEGVYLRRRASKRILHIDEEKIEEDVILKVLRNINGREVEVSRVSLRQVSEDEGKEILEKEDRVDSRISSRTYG